MWQEKEKQLYRKFEFKDFKEATEFVAGVAALAQAHNHHPRWQNEYNKVEIWLSTHSEGGRITNKDKKLAQAIERLYETKNSNKLGVKIDKAKLYTDGGSRGNPGKSAGAFVICKMDDNVVKKSGFYLGITTNNQAEYQALISGLKKSAELGVRELSVFIDSELIVKQLNGLYKIKNKGLEPLFAQVKQLSGSFKKISFIHVPRVQNAIADKEVNRILDQQKTA